MWCGWLYFLGWLFLNFKRCTLNLIGKFFIYFDGYWLLSIHQSVVGIFISSSLEKIFHQVLLGDPNESSALIFEDCKTPRSTSQGTQVSLPWYLKQHSFFCPKLLILESICPRKSQALIFSIVLIIHFKRNHFLCFTCI